MALPATDSRYLGDRMSQHTVATECGMICVVLPSFELPRGFDHSHSDLLLRLSPGYPDVPPDMWWFDPPVKLAVIGYRVSVERPVCGERERRSALARGAAV